MRFTYGLQQIEVSARLATWIRSGNLRLYVKRRQAGTFLPQETQEMFWLRFSAFVQPHGAQCNVNSTNSIVVN
jgi:hypothetical protein